jgi:anti-sigma regulatory factor (Ser/Thr protein kinase)
MSAATTPLITWSRTFPAAAPQVREARQFLTTVMDDHPAVADALVCLSELVTNAIVHSRSRQPGGQFTVRVHRHSQGLRVEVCDQGGLWHPPGQTIEDGEHGRGLLIVSQLASRWGCEGHSQHGWTVWFDVEIHPSAEANQ